MTLPFNALNEPNRVESIESYNYSMSAGGRQEPLIARNLSERSDLNLAFIL